MGIMNRYPCVLKPPYNPHCLGGNRYRITGKHQTQGWGVGDRPCGDFHSFHHFHQNLLTSLSR